MINYNASGLQLDIVWLLALLKENFPAVFLPSKAYGVIIVDLQSPQPLALRSLPAYTFRREVKMHLSSYGESLTGKVALNRPDPDLLFTWPETKSGQKSRERVSGTNSAHHMLTFFQGVQSGAFSLFEQRTRGSIHSGFSASRGRGTDRVRLRSFLTNRIVLGRLGL